MLARELLDAKEKARRAATAYSERHQHADATVAYNAERVHVNFMDGASVRKNWKLACACLDNIRRYYPVVPPRHFLPSGFSDAHEPHIEAYMRKWDEKIARKARALRKSSERARWKGWSAEAGAQRAWEHREFSWVSQTQDEEDGRGRQYAWRQRGLSLRPSHE
jgi:hypothetical protein